MISVRRQLTHPELWPQIPPCSHSLLWPLFSTSAVPAPVIHDILRDVIPLSHFIPCVYIDLFPMYYKVVQIISWKKNLAMKPNIKEMLSKATEGELLGQAWQRPLGRAPGRDLTSSTPRSPSLRSLKCFAVCNVSVSSAPSVPRSPVSRCCLCVCMLLLFSYFL